MKRFISTVLLTAASIMPLTSSAWEPTKPVTIFSGHNSGSGNELAFRKLAEIVQRNNTKFIYVIQNTPGADSVISQNRFFNAAPDGYSVAIPSHMSTYITNDIWQKNIKKFNYDSFTDVLTMGKSPLVLVASPRSMINTPDDFITLISTTKQPINIAVGVAPIELHLNISCIAGKATKKWSNLLDSMARFLLLPVWQHMMAKSEPSSELCRLLLLNHC